MPDRDGDAVSLAHRVERVPRNRAVTLAIATAALIALAYDALGVRHEYFYGADIGAVYGGAEALRLHGDPYLFGPFVYPPIAAVAFLPFTLLGHHVGALGAAIALVALAFTSCVCGALLEGRPFGRLAWVTLLVLAVAPNGWLAIATGNLQTPVVALALAALLALDRRRPVLGALLLGLAVAFKPVVVPFAIVFLLRREWRALIWGGAAAAGVNLLALVVLKDPAVFFTHVLPHVLHGATVTSADNLSVWAIGQRAPQWSSIVPVLDVAVVVTTAATVWFARSCRRPIESLIVATSLTMSSFLLTRVDEPFYSLLAIPALVFLLLAPRPRPIRLLVLIALVLVATFGSPYSSFLGPHSAFIGTLGQLLALVVFAVEGQRSRRRAMAS